MEIKKISLEEFKTLVEDGTKRAAYGQNQALLKKAETEALMLTFENERKAVSKLTALYVVRRKLSAQARIIRRDNVLYLGPGEYVPTHRKNPSDR